MDVVNLLPASMLTADMVPDNPGGLALSLSCQRPPHRREDDKVPRHHVRSHWSPTEMKKVGLDLPTATPMPRDRPALRSVLEALREAEALAEQVLAHEGAP